MDISNYNIEQCDAVSVLNAIMDMHDRPAQIAVAQMNQTLSSLNQGKAALAAAITEQGVPSSVDDTLQTMAEKVASIVAHILDTTGFVWSGSQPTTLQEALLRFNQITEATIYGNSILATSSLKKITLPTATDLSNTGYYNTAAQGTIQEIYAPNCLSFGSRFIYAMSSVRVFDMSSCYNISGYNPGIGEGITGNVNLIDLRVGKNFVSNENLSRWTPTNALLTDSKSCMTAEEIAAHPTWYNRDLLLYNIREHLAKNLRTDVGNRTITFASAVKAAIQADADTMAAFPSNWTIA